MILDDCGAEVAEGVPGELVIESPAVGMGYDSEGDEARSGSRFEGRRFHTGDRVVRERGVFCFRGRLKVFIAAAGHKVDPAEVEQVLLSHPDIADAAVVGHPAGEGREEVKALVVIRRPIEPLALMDFCSRSLAAYKVPRIIEIRDSLPRNAMGKLQREAL
jgi:long-chain acyl-CoA synthetase